MDGDTQNFQPGPKLPSSDAEPELDSDGWSPEFRLSQSTLPPSQSSAERAVDEYNMQKDLQKMQTQKTLIKVVLE
jgi:hypothetical protein